MSEYAGLDVRVTEAAEVVRGARTAPAFLTCEHASLRLPEPWQWPERDLRLVGTHWSYDLGAREVTLELARALHASAVLSRFSRLLVDPNRDEGHPDAFRAEADGEPVLLNTNLAAEDRARRIERYHRPFHVEVDQALAAVDAPMLFSIHSFTPNYQGELRAVEIGVLFNHEERLAHQLGAILSEEFERVAYNEPWSGRAGLIYSAERHSGRHGRLALELEVRQDRAVDPAFRARLIPVLARFFRDKVARA
ncbi:MAG TPA: N-formylglutamate amidohydrolase [Polyangiales bacterium]